MILKIFISSILLVLLVVTGIFLTRSGKPYHGLVFTLHKMLTLALGFIGLRVSGGMMSLDKYQGVMLWVHRVSVAVLIGCFSDLMIVLFAERAG